MDEVERKRRKGGEGRNEGERRKGSDRRVKKRERGET